MTGDGLISNTCFTSASGMRVALLPQRRRFVAAAIVIAAGANDELTFARGVAHYLEHVCFRGAFGFNDARALNRVLGRQGGECNAYTAHDHTCFFLRTTEEAFPDAFDALLALVYKPLLRAADIDSERGPIIEELAGYEDAHDFEAMKWAREQLYAGSRYVREIGGSRHDVESLDVTSIRKFHARWYRASFSTLAVTGPITDLMRAIIAERVATQVPHAPEHDRYVGFESSIRSKRAEFHADAQQALLHIHMRGPSRRASMRQRLAATLLRDYLGHGPASRIYEELRERRGLCYQVGLEHVDHFDAGQWFAHVSCDPANVTKAERYLLAELRKVAADGIPDDDFERVVDNMRGALIAEQESLTRYAINAAAELALMSDSEMDRFPVVGVDEAPRRIPSTDMSRFEFLRRGAALLDVTRRDVHEAAQDFTKARVTATVLPGRRKRSSKR